MANDNRLPVTCVSLTFPASPTQTERGGTSRFGDPLDMIGSREVTSLNSSVSPGRYRRRWKDLGGRQYKILYLAPERLVTEEMLAALQAWNVGLIAVDEAHCISEWGHDFRPEYRELAVLRQRFPG